MALLRAAECSKAQATGVILASWFTNLPLAYELVGNLRDDRPLHAYEHWLASFDTLLPGDRQMITRVLARWDNLPHVCLHLVGEGDSTAAAHPCQHRGALLPDKPCHLAGAER